MIYGIFSGWYSDWEAIGYFTDEKQAEEYCEKMNKRADKPYEEYYALPMIALDGTEEPKKRLAWVVDVESWNVSRCEEGDDRPPEDGTFFKKYRWGNNSYILWLYPGEETKAVKIAQDCLAQWKAEREGIG